MRLWQQARYARNSTAIALLMTPVAVPMAATMITAAIIAAYQINNIRSVRSVAFSIGRTALVQAFDYTVNHFAHVETDMKKPAVIAPAEPRHSVKGDAAKKDGTDPVPAPATDPQWVGKSVAKHEDAPAVEKPVIHRKTKRAHCKPPPHRACKCGLEPPPDATCNCGIEPPHGWYHRFDREEPYTPLGRRPYFQAEGFDE